MQSKKQEHAIRVENLKSATKSCQLLETKELLHLVVDMASWKKNESLEIWASAVSAVLEERCPSPFGIERAA